ncbi:MAG: hypothetical protein AB7G47_04435 [Mycolicibacterium sp.]|uniref:hypothetical protein n=1 Tax=Mycolicibacterium sp. TaxID=2320850 RepID=UPI003D0D47E1
MHTVLGLSLDTDDFAWVLVDVTDGVLLDHDALKLRSDPERAVEVVRSAHAIAENCGFDVDRVRITWTRTTTRDGMRLRARLGCLDMGDIEAVPLAHASEVPIDAPIEGAATGIPPTLALAYGAAVAPAPPRTDTEGPAVSPIPAKGVRPRRRAVAALLGSAAAALFGLLCLSAGAGPESPPPAAATAGPPPAAVGWEAVPAPASAGTAATRKVVAVPTHAEQWSPSAVQSYAQVDAVPAAAVQTVPEPVRQSHLSGTAHLSSPEHLSSPTHSLGRLPGPVEVVDTAPALDLTQIAQAFTALP